MCSLALVIMLGCVTDVCATASSALQASEAAGVQDKLVGRVLKSEKPRGANLDVTTLGKRHAVGTQENKELEVTHLAANRSAGVMPKSKPESTTKHSGGAQPKEELELAQSQSASVQDKLKAEKPKLTTKKSGGVQPKVGIELAANESTGMQHASKPDSAVKGPAIVQPKVGVELAANVSSDAKPKAQIELVANQTIGEQHKSQPVAAQEPAKKPTSSVQPKSTGVQYSEKEEPTAPHSADKQRKTVIELAESASLSAGHKLKSDSTAKISSGTQHKMAFELAARKSAGIQQVYHSMGVVPAILLVLFASACAILLRYRFHRRALADSDYVMLIA